MDYLSTKLAEPAVQFRLSIFGMTSTFLVSNLLALSQTNSNISEWHGFVFFYEGLVFFFAFAEFVFLCMIATDVGEKLMEKHKMKRSDALDITNK